MQKRNVKCKGSKRCIPLVSRAKDGMSSGRQLVKSNTLFFFFGQSSCAAFTCAGVFFCNAAVVTFGFTAVTRYLLSTVLLVGKSSKISNSDPSPKLRFLVGWVRVPILAASLRRCSGAMVGVVAFRAVAVEEQELLGECLAPLFRIAEVRPS